MGVTMEGRRRIHHRAVYNLSHPDAPEAGPKMDFLFSIPFLPQILVVVVLFVAYQQIASRVKIRRRAGPAAWTTSWARSCPATGKRS
jgi:hypothetical protein